MDSGVSDLSWHALALAQTDPHNAARLMRCSVGTAIKQLRSASGRVESAHALRRAALERSATQVAAKACGLACVEVGLSDADDRRVGAAENGVSQRARQRRRVGKGQARRDMARLESLPKSLEIVLPCELGRRLERA